jgi:hypothetical protein
MTLLDYLKREKISKYRAAKELGVAWTTLWRWTHSDAATRTIPGPQQMLAVQEWSRGKVKPNDWVRA